MKVKLKCDNGKFLDLIKSYLCMYTNKLPPKIQRLYVQLLYLCDDLLHFVLFFGFRGILRLG